MSNNCLINGDIINTLIESEEINQIITISNITKDEEESLKINEIKRLVNSLD